MSFPQYEGKSVTHTHTHKTVENYYVFLNLCVYGQENGRQEFYKKMVIITIIIIITTMGDSNGKLPPRTCPGCSVPEPYRSHDWALVPANPASKAEY